MTRTRTIRAAGLSLALWLAAPGCTSKVLLESRKVEPGLSTPLEGISYYLPKKLLKLQVWKFTVDEPTVAPSMPPAIPEEAPPSAAATRRVVKHFAVHADDGTDEVVLPDLRHQFVIVPRWDSASHDVIDVELTRDGLLTKVSGKASDQRADIAKGIVDLVSLLVGAPPSPSSYDTASRSLEDVKGVPRYVAGYEFDPIDPVDRERVRAALAGFGITLTLTRQSDCPVATSGAGCCTTCDATQPGIYYRLPIPYRLSLSPAGIYRKVGPLAQGATGEWESLEGGMERTVLLPNEAVCIYAPVSRAAFVSSHTDLTFDRGMLTKVATDKPSELLGFVKIPVDAVSAILAIPAQLLTVRIDRINKEQNLAAAETSLAAAQAAQVKQQIELLQALQALREASPGTPAPTNR